MKKKLFVLALSFALLTSFCMKGTFATEAVSQPEVSSPCCSCDSMTEECTCPCHNQEKLFQQLMNSENLEEFWKHLEGYTNEELIAIFDDEKLMKINQKLDCLLPPAPEVIMRENMNNGFSQQVEDSKMITPTVNYSNVAPFREPVIG